MSRRSELLWLLLITCIGLLLRLDFLIAQGFIIDSDEAIVGLMARDILAHTSAPIFYYGQHYMGSFEPYCAAVAFWIFGATPVVLKSVPLFFSLLLIPLTFSLSRLMISSRGALIAAFLIAIAPSPLISWSSMARGGFVELICLGVLSQIYLVRWLQQTGRGVCNLMLCFFVLGFGWWTNNQIIFFIVPALFAIATVIKAALCGGARVSSAAGYFFKCSALVCGAFLVGSAPFWYYNILNHFPSRGLFVLATWSEFIEHLQGCFSTALPILLGAKRFWNDSDLFPGATLCVYLVWGVLSIVYLRTRAKKIADLFLAKIDSTSPLELYALFIPAALLIFSLSSFGFLVQAPRYLLPLYPVFALLGAYSIETVAARSRGAACSLLALLVVITLCSNFHGGRAIPGEPFVYGTERASKNHHKLIAWLKKNRYHFVKTNYWIGYRLAFETAERVRFMIAYPPQTRRIASYEDAGRAEPLARVPFVLTPTQAREVASALRQSCYRYKQIVLSGYHVIYDVRHEQGVLRQIPATDYTLSASAGNKTLAQANDGDRTTRWGSAHPQTVGMWVSVDFRAPVPLRGFELDLAGWPQDAPRGLTVTRVLSDNTEETIVSPTQGEMLEKVREFVPDATVCMAPRPTKKLTFTLQGSDPIFDWSIAEVLLYESIAAKDRS